MAAARRARELGVALVEVGDNVNDARRLINKGADTNYVDKWMEEGEERSTTPLIQAARLGHANVVSVLIEKGADVNKKEPCNRNTALIVAAHCGQHEIAIRLLDHGADINATDKLGFTPLSAAAQKCHLPIVDHLILRGADLNRSNFEGATPLILAAQEGHLEVVKLLLVEKGAVDQPNNYGCTALGQASHYGYLEVIDFLLSAGANINHLSVRGLSPLHIAAQGGNLNVVKLLVKKGAYIHQASYLGVTPLQLAALSGHKEVVDYLMSKGATFEAAGTTAKVCKCCGAANATMKCALCFTVYYCSPECQKKDWKEGGENRHKIQCAALTEARARYMEKAKREIEEKIAEFGMLNGVGSGLGAGPSTTSG